jgi:ABC-type glycerol-3-phosphate transport system substrate-binding protein
MKKLFILILCVVFIVSMVISVIGCKDGTTEETAEVVEAAEVEETAEASETAEVIETAEAEEITDPVTIRFWRHQTPTNEQLFNEMIEEFKSVEPLITVNFESIGINDYDQKLSVAIAAGDTPDVYAIYDVQFEIFFDKGLLAPVDVSAMGYSSVEDCLDERFLPTSMDFAVKDGQLYSAGWAESANWAIVYNKACFDNAGVAYPSVDKVMTWEEYFELAKSLTLYDDGNMTQMGEGMFISNMDNPDGARYILDPIFRQLGGLPFDEITGESLNKDVWVKVGKMMQDASLKGKYGYLDPGFPTATNAHTEMFAGRIGMAMGGPWAEGWGKSIDENIEMGFAPYPQVDSANNDSTTGGWVFVINKESSPEQQIAAAKFIEFISNDKNSVRWFKDAGLFMPRNIEGFKEDLLEISPNMEVFFNDAPRSKMTIYGEMGAERWTVLKKMAEAIFKMGMDPEQAVEDAWSELATIY